MDWGVTEGTSDNKTVNSDKMECIMIDDIVADRNHCVLAIESYHRLLSMRKNQIRLNVRERGENGSKPNQATLKPKRQITI